MAGIYHNATLGVISLSSDGSNWITIADKNLGATSTDITSTNSYGKFYQFGNSTGIPYYDSSLITNSTAQNTTGKGAGIFFYGAEHTLYNASPYWDSALNLDLWGEVTNTNSARRGPCPEGWHIFSINDLSSLSSVLTSLGLNNTTGIMNYLKIPKAGRLTNMGSWSEQGSSIYIHSTYGQEMTGYNYISNYIGIYSYNNSNNVSRGSASTNGVIAMPIRPLKNEPVIPDYNDVWNTLYGDELPDRPPIPKLKRLQKGGNYYYFKEAPTHASAISLNKSSITLTEAGQTEQLVATVTPSDAVDKSIIWTSSNENVARVSSNGLVSCITPGDCTITATTNDGNHTASCSVSMIHVTGVSLNTNSINLSTAGQTYQLTATITPNDATNKNVTWSSSDTSIATVSSTGLITCVTPGSATITVTTEDGGYTATCSVTNIKYLSVCYLIVGGGGNGYTACWGAGGGGGGAVCCGSLSLNSNHYYMSGGVCCPGYLICVGGPKCTSSIYGYKYAAGGCDGGCENGGASGSGLAGGGTNRGYAGGGGGGAGSTGMPGNEYYGGEGGAGLYGYGGGGGGGGSGSCAAGRDGGGGNGVGPTNCGGGGGGGYNMSGSGGACGVVDICYLIGAGGGTGGNCCYTCNGYCVHRFTSNGTFKVNS